MGDTDCSVIIFGVSMSSVRFSAPDGCRSIDVANLTYPHDTVVCEGIRIMSYPNETLHEMYTFRRVFYACDANVTGINFGVANSRPRPKLCDIGRRNAYTGH